MATKLIHFAKMSWMLYWRFFVIGTVLFAGRHNGVIFWIALAIAGVSVFAFNRTLLTWPLFRLITRKTVVIPANSWGSDGATAPRKAVPQGHRYSPSARRGAPGRPHLGTPGTGATATPVIQTATANGRMTGFEPSALENRPVPKAATMIGTPGAGLHNATGMTQTNIGLGVKGEENFARALAATGHLSRFGTIWSVPVPDQDRFVPGPYGTDIDCILATESAIFLIDLKNYKSGNVRYYSQGANLYCEDVPTGHRVGEVKEMSRNMEMATAAVRRHFPNANIVPVVVFMPTDKGEGVLENVVWPGGIPAMNLTEFLAVLANQGNFSWNLPHGGAFGRLGNLLTMGASKVR